MDIKELFSTSNLTTRQLGDKVGLSGSQVSQIATGKTPARPMLVKLCRLVFWKELGISQIEILQELNLNESISGYTNETTSSFINENNSELESKITQLEREKEILYTTIETLNRQLNDK